MIVHDNRLPADDSHELSCLICYLKNKTKKPSKICYCRLLQIIGGALWVNQFYFIVSSDLAIVFK